MAPRTRSSTNSRPKGTWRRFGQTSGGWDLVNGSSVISDHTGPGDGAQLTVNHWDISGGKIHSNVDPGYWGSYWQNYCADVFDNIANFPHWDSSLEQHRSVNSYAVEAVARTNPSRPYVDIPVNILELGDVARLIQDTGKSLLRTAGSWNLRYNFGIKPLVSDLVKLTNFQDQLERRIKELGRLAGAKGLRRTVDLGSYRGTANVVKTIQSVGGFISGNFSQETTRRVRGHVRWTPQNTFSSLSSSEKTRLAVRSLLGLTVDFSTLWEVMPWSWLIDWCSNAGQWFAAHRNIVPAQLSGVQIMTESRTTYITPSQPIVDGSFGSATVSRVTKLRQVGSVLPSAHFPFLTGNQMGILASLAVTR